MGNLEIQKFNKYIHFLTLKDSLSKHDVQCKNLSQTVQQLHSQLRCHKFDLDINYLEQRLLFFKIKLMCLNNKYMVGWAKKHIFPEFGM